MVSSKNFKNKKLIFLVDSGSRISLIKKSKISNETFINKKEKNILFGIGPKHVETIGTAPIKIFSNECKFHILQDNDFNAQFDGILGREFCKKAKWDVLFSENCIQSGEDFIPFYENKDIVIPARTKQLIPVNIINFKEKEGLIEEMNLGKNIFTGNVIAKNYFGKAYIYAVNANEYDVKICPKPIKLLNYKILNKNFDQFNIDDFESIHHIDNETIIRHNKKRVKNLMKLIDLKNLNYEEKEHINQLLMESSENFIYYQENLLRWRQEILSK